MIDKPHGMLSVPSRSGEADSRPCAGRILERETGSQIFPVHRLDFEVGGLLMFARTADAHRHACRWFEQHFIQKTYEAWAIPVAGYEAVVQKLVIDSRESWLTWEAQLVRGKRRAFEAPHGKPAITRARYLGADQGFGGATTPVYFETNANGLDQSNLMCWQLEPITGRSHQLRWEMARHGMPIVGDVLYGGLPLTEPQTIALRAVAMTISTKTNAAQFELPADGFRL